jgi:succinoglycan biosynthesis transport protein ExoP
MSGSLVPTPYSDNSITQRPAPSAIQTWEAPPTTPGTGSGGVLSLGRAVAALKRYKWLILIVTAVGSLGGFIASRFINPTYEVRSTIFIAEPTDPKGPIRPQEMLNDKAWTELLKSFQILEPVALKMGLFVTPQNDPDTILFRNFVPSASLTAGTYTLRVQPETKSYVLLRAGESRRREPTEVERGALGDSIGRAAGFHWQPSASMLAGRSTIEFNVATPRDAAIDLDKRLTAFVPPLQSSIMRLTLQGKRPTQLAKTMNMVLHQFVSEADTLKKRTLREFSRTLREQLDQQQRNLLASESELQSFNVSTATLPRENLPIAGGSTLTTPNAMTEFFKDRVAQDNAKRDREALEAVVAEAKQSGVRVEALYSLPTVLNSSPQLAQALTALQKEQASLSALKQQYTDAHPSVIKSQQGVDRMLKETIPAILERTLEQLRRSETEINRRITGATKEIRDIPARAIREQALQRERDVAAKLYEDLRGRYSQANLSEASAIPEVSILDSAVTPLVPMSSSTPMMILVVVIAGSFVLSIATALLLDLLDKRFRYPEQASHELGLEILGGIPNIRRTRRGVARIEDAAQLVEAFRALRLSVRNACDPAEPIALTISSPGPGDGKSFISSNLALSFAEIGYRTLLVDGDIRRGQLHAMFGVSQRPGLVDYLLGDATLDEVIRETSHANMFLLPSGSRRHRGPELLAAEGTTELLRLLRAQFDAVIVDSAPLGAGIDPFALGAATGRMTIVLRAGKTDRKLAQAKLTTLDRLPVHMLGAILNDIPTAGQYKYYSYLEGYGTLDEDEPPRRIVPGNGEPAALSGETSPARPRTR